MRPRRAVLLAAALSAPLLARGADPSGFVRADDGTIVEITGRNTFRLTPGAARATPVASPAGSAAPAPQRAAGGGEAAGPEAEPVRVSLAAEPCRAERSAYLREVLRASGVEVDDPLSLLDGLAGPNGYSAAWLFTPHGLLPGFDPIAPLAWSFELRSRARDLARCAQATAR